jgi:hypothetical protein
MDKTGRALAVGFQSLLVTDSAVMTRYAVIIVKRAEQLVGPERRELVM